MRELKSAIPGKKQGFESEIDSRRSALGKSYAEESLKKRFAETVNRNE